MVSPAIDWERARRLARVISLVGLDKILLLEETDPQLHAVTRVASVNGRGVASYTSALVALVSYRLSGTGEEWWTCYGEHFSTPLPPDPGALVERVLGFLDECSHARVQREAKKRRIMRAYQGAGNTLTRLLRDPDSVLPSVSWLLNELAKALRSEPWKKTIAFAGKMAYYSARTTQRIPAPWDSIVPVDLRIACLTYTSQLVRAHSREEIMRDPRPAIGAWSWIGRQAGVPPYNLDSLLWLAGNPSRFPRIEEARRYIASRLRGVLGGLGDLLASELVRVPCKTGRAKRPRV